MAKKKNTSDQALYSRYFEAFVSDETAAAKARDDGRKATYCAPIDFALAYHYRGAYGEQGGERKEAAAALRQDVLAAFPKFGKHKLDKYCQDARGLLGILPEGTPMTFEGIDGFLQGLATGNRKVRSGSDVRGIVKATKENGGVPTLPTRKGNGRGNGSGTGTPHESMDSATKVLAWVNLFGGFSAAERTEALNGLAKNYSDDISALMDRIDSPPAE